MTLHTLKPLVSICCITYNHAAFIAEAIEGFLMQQTSFDFEIIIGEDHSDDETRNILETYEAAYPRLITVVNRDRNIGAVRNHVDTFSRARGRYIALCDGDDFWTDPLKLQKQVDFLEANPDYVICCHHTRVIDENYQTVYLKPLPLEMEFAYTDVLLGNREETRICSLMVRNLEFIHGLGKLDWYYDSHGADTLFKLYILANSKQKIYVMPDVMACYRIHKGGIWSMIDDKVRKRKMLSDFNIVVDHFSYTSSIRRSLLRIYLQEYFLFDIRNFQINSACRTLYNLF